MREQTTAGKQRLKLKMFLGILLALVMTGVFFAAVYISGVRSLVQTEMAQTNERIRGIQDVFSGMAELSEQALNNFQQRDDPGNLADHA